MNEFYNVVHGQLFSKPIILKCRNYFTFSDKIMTK